MRLTAVAATLAASLLLASSAFGADKVKVGFVSTLSGPGAGLVSISAMASIWR